jgi:hypothetical protein
LQRFEYIEHKGQEETPLRLDEEFHGNPGHDGPDRGKEGRLDVEDALHGRDATGPDATAVGRPGHPGVARYFRVVVTDVAIVRVFDGILQDL